MCATLGFLFLFALLVGWVGLAHCDCSGGGMVWWIKGMSGTSKEAVLKDTKMLHFAALGKRAASTLIFFQEVLPAPAVEILQEMHSLAAISEASPATAG